MKTANARATSDEFLFEADDAEFDLVLGEDGKPLNGEEEVVRIDRVEKAVHARWSDGDVRIYATATIVRTEQRALKVWTLECGGNCRRCVGARCANPRTKRGAAGHLRTDAAVALGRRLTSRERFSKQMFLGKTFRAPVSAVMADPDGNPRPGSAWYSKVGPFIGREQ